MNLRHLSNSDLHNNTKQKAEGERFATIDLLWHLREVERRMLFAEMSYRDLKEYCVKELKHSESSAWRRINAMRLLKELPEMESKIQSGELNLTQVTMARTHFRDVKASNQEKKEILLSLENQSIRVTERILAEKKPEGFIPAPVEIERALRGQKLELTIILDEELQEDIAEIEQLTGKKYSKLELFKRMTKATLARLRKKSTDKSTNKITRVDMNNLSKVSTAKAKSIQIKKLVTKEAATTIVEVIPSKLSQTNVLHERKAQPAPVSKSQQSSRYIPVEVRRFISARDQNRCQYVDPHSKRQCKARQHLQFEHKHPFSQGGTHSKSNLQLLCSNHNALRAVQVFGAEKMKNYLSTIT